MDSGRAFHSFGRDTGCHCPGSQPHYSGHFIPGAGAAQQSELLRHPRALVPIPQANEAAAKVVRAQR